MDSQRAEARACWPIWRGQRRISPYPRTCEFPVPSIAITQIAMDSPLRLALQTAAPAALPAESIHRGQPATAGRATWDRTSYLSSANSHSNLARTAAFADQLFMALPHRLA